MVLEPDEADLILRAIERAREVHAEQAAKSEPQKRERPRTEQGSDISGVSAEGAPGKAWVRRMPCESVTETLRRNPAGQSRPAKAGNQPEPSVAWCGGNPGCEAYTGSVQAVRLSLEKKLLAGAVVVF
jgi:hypothetical protein